MADQVSTSTQTSSIPAILQPYVTSMLSNASNLTNPNLNPYAGLGSYYNATGQTPFAQINPLLKQGAQESEKLGPSQYLGQGANMAGAAGLGSLNAGSNYLGMASNPYAVNQFMNPYLSNVTERQKQGAINDYARTIPGMGANAARVGGLRGSRNALVQAEGQRNLGNRLDDITASGLSGAYNNAQDILNRGTQFNLQGYGQGINAANTMGQLGNTEFNQNLASIQNRNAVGNDLYNKESDVSKARYTDYQNMMNDPMNKINQFSSILRNVPLQGGTTTTTTPGSSGWADTAGMLAGIAALWKALNP